MCRCRSRAAFAAFSKDLSVFGTTTLEAAHVGSISKQLDGLVAFSEVRTRQAHAGGCLGEGGEKERDSRVVTVCVYPATPVSRSVPRRA